MDFLIPVFIFVSVTLTCFAIAALLVFTIDWWDKDEFK